MPPTFLLFVGTIAYIPTLAGAVCLGCLLMAIRHTRLLGKRLVCAALSTIPGLVAGFVIGGLVGGVTLGSALLLKQSLPLPFIAFISVSGFWLTILATLASLLVSIRIGWRMGFERGMWEVIERDPLLRRFDPWYGTLRPRA